MDGAETAYQFIWLIEDYSYAARNSGWLRSPKFFSEGLERSSWCLVLNPIYLRMKGYNSLCFERSNDDAGPEILSVKFEISFITWNGFTLYSEQCEHTFRKGEARYFIVFLDMSELYVRRNTDFLPRDTLTVSCKIWRGDGRAQKATQYTARTLIEIEKVRFEHRIRNFSDLEMDKNRIQIKSVSQEGCVFSSDLWISTQGSCEGSIIVDVKSSTAHCPLMSKRISVAGLAGKIIKLFDIDYRFKNRYEEEGEMFKNFTKQFLVEREFLANDELILLCDCTFKTGFASSDIQETRPEFPITADQTVNCDPQTKNDSKAMKPSASCIASESIKRGNNSGEKMSTRSTAIDDFKALYSDKLLTDVELKTGTESFPAHKSIVCAWSMLNHETEEKNTYCVKVDDSEDKIKRQLLLFLFADNLEDLQWESALNLYHDSDKHEVRSLKILCSYFLVDNLSPSNASELLLLADRHNDDQLKEIVETFILKHEREVFRSEKWRKLCKTNPELGLETMLSKYNREESGK